MSQQELRMLVASISNQGGNVKKRLKSIPVIAVVSLALALPTGFAIAQIADQPEAEEPPITRVDPDPSTDAIEIGAAYNKAVESGNQDAIDQASKAVRDEWLSRLSPEERASAESGPPNPDVPADTFAYLSPAITDVQISQCQARLDEGHQDQLCELILLFGEGKVAAGPYTKAEVKGILGEKEEIR
jgi:hypothetical protein